MPPAAATAAARAKRDAPTIERPSSQRRAPAAPPRPTARPAVRTSSKARAAAAAVETTLAPPPREPRVAQPRSAPTRTAPGREAPKTSPRSPRRPSHESPQRLRVTRERLAPRRPTALLRVLVPKQRWLDRIVRGRAWIPALGLTLLAIVGLRVEVLKLSSGVGSQIQQAAELQSSNATLRSSVSALSDNQRIEELAKTMGMVMPGPMDVHFVHAAAGTHVDAAIKAIHTPESDTFLTSLADEREADETNATAAASTSAVGALADTVSAPAVNDTSATNGSTATSATTNADTPDTATATDPTTDASTTSSASTDESPAGTSSVTSTDTSPGASAVATSQTGDTTYDSSGDGTADATETPASSAATAPTTTGGSTTGGSSLAG